MFTVKATYHNETRKFTFDSSFFPTFRDISEQLAKVFSITHSYSLRRLLFSPEQGSFGTYMISSEVRTESCYNQLVALYRDKEWPGALLKFTVEDVSFNQESGIPSLSPNNSMRKGKDPEEWVSKRFSHRSSTFCTPVAPFPPPPPRIPIPPPWAAAWAQRKLPTPPPPPAAYCVPIPPPPILYPSPSIHTSQIPMDVDPMPSVSCQRQPSVTPAHVSALHHGTSLPGPCCDISQGKQDVHEAMSDFMETLIRVMRAFDPNFRIPAAQSASVASTAARAAPPDQETSTNDSENILPIPGSFAQQMPVHNGIICDACGATIRGIRHKCLDCPDYDMCTPCITGKYSEHAQSHEFFKIEEPGHVIVHTVFSENEEKQSRHSQTGMCQSEQGPNQNTPVVHNATCDLCDSRIRGDRFKCVNCPDFDTCASCFTITSEQHPGHSFVNVTDPLNLIARKRTLTRHFALCDGCKKPVRGIRYKCMTCPDFDLCENCEALPIPVHPPTHHMLKIKTLDAAIPAPVSRVPSSARSAEPPIVVSQTSLVEVPSVHTTPVVKTPSLPPAHPCESNDSAMQIPSSFETSPVADLMTFPEMSQTRDSLSSTPTLPVVNCTGPLISDLNVLVEAPPLPTAASLPQGSDMTLSVTPIQSAGQPTAADDLETTIAHDPMSVSAELDTFHIPGSLTPSDVSSVPRIENFNHEQWRDLWPEMKDILNSILQPVPANAANPGSSTTAPFVPDFPLPMIRPTIYAKLPSDIMTRTINTPTDLASIATDEASKQSSPAVKSVVQLPVESTPSPTPTNATGLSLPAKVEIPLRATFLSDNNIPDGQIFPPGAEFVKSWKMSNDGTRDWPETSQLIFVAGDKLTTENDQGIVHIGKVQAGAEIDVWTGEMKAPDAPGKYVSYWRLNDGQGNHFGHSLWADITVSEPQNTADVSDENSLASSSVIMPQSAPERSSLSANEAINPPARTSAATTETFSDTGSDISDLSVVNIPSSPSLSSNDSIDWEDTVEHIAPPQARVEYVVLYDDSSDDELI